MNTKIIVMLIICASLLIVGCVGDDSDIQSPDGTDEMDEGAENESENGEDEILDEEIGEEVPTIEPQERTIRLFAYRCFPSSTITINQSDTVVWWNVERDNRRNFMLVSENGLWEDQTIGTLAKFNYTFEEAGIYKFTIPPWNAMNMTIIVN
ncbi:MAG: hypothetical protein K8R64_01480 [Methanosarcinaceae archaeon]|nr:hypothetical protein [Methanosarcinaceae archaeon]